MKKFLASISALALLASSSVAFAQGSPANFPAPGTLTGAEIVPCFQNVGWKRCTVTGLFTGTFGAPSPIGNVTPNSGVFTTLGATGLITPAAGIGIQGQTSGASPPAGSQGEYKTQAFSAVVTSSGAATLASFSLSAGNWLVGGAAVFLSAGGFITNCTSGINTVSTGFGSAGTYAQVTATSAAQQSVFTGIPAPVPYFLTSPTTIYFVGSCVPSAGTSNASGNMWAIRIS